MSKMTREQKRNRPSTVDPQTTLRAIEAWQRCDDFSSWPPAIDTIMVAELQGEQLAWARLNGESFTIFRISDSAVVDEVALPTELAIALDWRVTEFRPAIPLPLTGTVARRTGSARVAA